MRVVTQIPHRLVLLLLTILLLIAVSGFKTDPTDDFSFSFTHGRGSDSATLMSEQEIALVFAERLALFPTSQSDRLARHLMKLCRKYHFDPAFVLSLVEVESSFRVNVVSPAGAMGLMQLMPATARVVAKRYGIRFTGERALLDPYTNLSLGVAYLSLLREKYRELSPYFHVAAYNIGPARLDELRSRKSFKPVKTRQYYEAIRRGVPALRFFRGGTKAKTATPAGRL